jgi:hypothetical protein
MSGRARDLPIQRWGDRVTMSDAPLETSARPDRMVAWGRTEFITIGTGQVVEMARVQTDGEHASQSFLVSIDVLQPADPTLQSFFDPATAYVWATIEAGNGAETFRREVRIDDRLDVAVCGSLVRVTCYVADKDGNVDTVSVWNTGGEPENNVQVAVNVSREIRGAPYVPNQNLFGQTAASTVLLLSALPLQILSLHAHLQAPSVGDDGTTPVDLFLQLFDVGAAGDVVGGRVPDDEYVLSGGLIVEEVEEVFVNQRGYGRGLAVAVSTTSGTYTASTATVWVQVQRQAL